MDESPNASTIDDMIKTASWDASPPRDDDGSGEWSRSAPTHVDIPAARAARREPVSRLALARQPSERTKRMHVSPQFLGKLFLMPDEGIVSGDTRVIPQGDKIPESAECRRAGIDQFGNVVLIWVDESWSAVSEGEIIPEIQPQWHQETIEPSAGTQRVYDLLWDIREGLHSMIDSKGITHQVDIDELNRLAGKANSAIGVVIGIK